MKIRILVIGGLFCAAGARGNAPSAAATAPAYVLLSHSDTQFAHDLFRLNQVSLIAAEAAAAKGTPAEDLWKSESIAVAWDNAAKDHAAQADDYRKEIAAYLEAHPQGIDGVWALDQVKFIVAHLAEFILNRMEYWGATAKDRAELAPLSALADRLLTQATLSLAAAMHDSETKSPFDEADYTRAYTANAEAEYYAAWVKYLQAMAMDAATDGGDAPRRRLLSSAADAIGKWADDKQDNGVNNQSLLLRGKARSESGQYDLAIADLQRAAVADNSPAWLRYQARYQSIVTRLRAGDFSAATTELAALRRTLAAGDLDAQMSTDMLAFRVAWAQAVAQPLPEQKSAKSAAIQILSNILQRDARFRALVYEQLAAKIPEGADPSTLMPLEQLALAFAKSENQSGDTPQSRAQLTEAAQAAETVLHSPDISPSDQREATFLAAVTNGLLHNLAAAARFNTDFAEMAPTDPRAKPLLELALQQLGELRKTQTSSTDTSQSILTLQLRALTLATGTFHDLRWRFAQARTLEDLNQLDAAAKLFSEIPVTDTTYFDARFRLVAIAMDHFNDLSKANSSTDLHTAANNLFSTCAQFIALLDNPPPEADKEAVAPARAYRADIWLIETSVALQPQVRQPQMALDCLAKLDALKAESKSALTDAQQTAVLRYRIEAYQMNNQPDQALAALRDYAAAQGKEPTDVIHAMAYETVDEITRDEKNNPEQARQLAQFVVKLLDPLIDAAKDPAQQETMYGYQKLQADMLVRAGQYADAQAMAIKLEAARPSDIFNYMTEARAIFEHARATADAKLYAQAQDLFTRILPKVVNGSDSFWECWLRILQAKEIIGGSDAQPTIKQRLGDLHIAFGDKIGGTTFQVEFAHLLEKYGA